jgi:hypothetical protein
MSLELIMASPAVVTIQAPGVNPAANAIHANYAPGDLPRLGSMTRLCKGFKRKKQKKTEGLQNKSSVPFLPFLPAELFSY